MCIHTNQTTIKCRHFPVKCLRMKLCCACTFFRIFSVSGAKVRPVQALFNRGAVLAVEARPAPAVSSAGTGARLRPFRTHPIRYGDSPVAVVDKNVSAGDGVTRRIQQDCGRATNHPRIDSDNRGARMVYVAAN